MIFRQITHDDLGCASYLVGDEEAGVAAVVDPRFEVDDYPELARYMGGRIEHVFETHNHADHVSGHGRLAAATGATIHIHRDAEPAYGHESFVDADEWELVEEALAKLGPQPPNFEAIVELNRGPLLTDGVELLPLAPRQLDQKRSEGALLVDVRTDQQFDDAHIGGAVCIPMLNAGFGSK